MDSTYQNPMPIKNIGGRSVMSTNGTKIPGARLIFGLPKSYFRMENITCITARAGEE